VEQATEFSRLAPNMIVKLPATQPGVAAIEESTYRGVSINATVSFTLAQAVSVAPPPSRVIVTGETDLPSERREE
jgi:transaldolase